MMLSQKLLNSLSRCLLVQIIQIIIISSLGSPVCGPYCYHGDCQSTPDGVTCVCETGYTGVRCDIEITSCTGVTCYNGGECIEDTGSGHVNNFTCLCRHGYTGNIFYITLFI